MKIPPPNVTDGPHYAQRDTLIQSNYFMRHMLAMTSECLHAKSAIAAELAHRDMEIDRLRAEVEALRELLAVRVAGALLYGDDGELQDNTQHPCIDFRRDSPEEIRRKLHERGLANYRRSLADEAGTGGGNG